MSFGLFSSLLSSGKCTVSKTAASLSQNELNNISKVSYTCILIYESTNTKT